jgi:DNA-binding HxlR family transcriptional regulator
MTQAEHLAHATLQLLNEPHSLPILRALMDGPRRPSELEQRLPDVPHSAIMRLLGDLRERGLAQHERHTGLPPSAEYALTAPGRLILGVASVAERWESTWTDGAADGLIALRLIGDEHTREILLALAGGPLSAGELVGEVHLTRSPLRQRVGDLVALGVLLRISGEARSAYELTDSARDLMRVSIAAARWAWEWTAPPVLPATANIAGVLQMYAPNAILAADLHGLCRLDVEGDRCAEVVYLAASGRALTPLPEPPATEPDATGRANAGEWCDGLLRHRWGAVRLTGEIALMGAILPCLSTALVG